MPYQIDDLSEDPNVDEEEEVGLFTSALAGIATGIYKIPTSVVSLGAELIDLGLDTNTAASVEKFFDDLNPLDEYAEARVSGRITQALAQVAQAQAQETPQQRAARIMAEIEQAKLTGAPVIA